VTLSAEVCVIGGGPAGSSTALRLARLGHDVVLIERSVFPRPRLGEALAPSIWPVLDVLGMREKVEGAGFIRCDRTILAWAGDRREVTSAAPGLFGLSIDRGRFDALLLESARRDGVRVLQPARAHKPQADGDGWVIAVEGPTGRNCIKARYLVDAAGRFTNIRPASPCSRPSTSALYGHWRDTALASADARVEAGDDAWYWGAPRPDGIFCAMAFIAADEHRRTRPELEARYRRLLAASSLLRDCLRGTLVDGLRLCDASTRRGAEPVSGTSIAVGEASFSVDPLSSQGVQLAIVSGIHASIVVHTILSYPDEAESAKAFYRRAQRDAFDRHRRIAGRYYAAQARSCPTRFWRERSADAVEAPAPPVDKPGLAAPAKLQLAAEAEVKETPVIDGDRIRMAKALHHPALDHPIAYLNGVAVAPLLLRIAAGSDPRTLVDSWSPALAPAQAWRILHWLIERRVLVAAE
jgi:flavin-dependent dehydrogenase